VGIATVDLDKPVEAVEMLEKAVCEYGFKGLKVLGTARVPLWSQRLGLTVRRNRLAVEASAE